jgi:ATP-dependent Clp protease protease subunit
MTYCLKIKISNNSLGVSMDGDKKEIVVNSFDEQAAREFREQVVSQSQRDPSSPIVIYIDSYGGYLDSLNMMLETMHQVPNQFITVCIGKAMSCGAVLLAAGDHRFCGRHSRVMIHQSTSGAYGPAESLQKEIDECKRLNDKFMTFLAKRCKKDLRQLKQIIKDNESRDLFLDADECKKFGIVDFVGTPSIKPILLYHIDVTPEKKYESGADDASVVLKNLISENKPKKTRKVNNKVSKNRSDKKTTRRR